MIKEAESHSEEAHQLRELADTRNHAESLAYQIEKSLSEQREKLDADARSTVEGRIMELRGVLESCDVSRDQGEDRRAAGGVDAGGLGAVRAGSASQPSATATTARATPTTRSSRTPSTRWSTSRERRVRRAGRAASRRPSASREPDPLDAVTRERDEYLDALQRLKAEFDNYRKRVARDQQELAARAHERLMKELVPVLDDLERALEAASQHEEAKLEDGVRLVHRSLADAARA